MNNKKNLFQSSLTSRCKAQGRIAKPSSNKQSTISTTQTVSVIHASTLKTNVTYSCLTPHNIKSKANAIKEIKGAILFNISNDDKDERPTLSNATSNKWLHDVKSSGYILVPSKLFCPVWKTLSSIYQHFQIMWLDNTLQSTGWAIFSHCFNGECLFEDGTKRY